MACGGLKLVEKSLGEGLRQKHHSVRATEFAFLVQNLMRKQRYLRDGSNVQMKIGIHFGNVISGVVGDSKP